MDGFLNGVTNVNNAVNGVVWGVPALALLAFVGIMMTVLTDLPGVQLYSGNHLNDETGKDGAFYTAGSGVCFETQFWPDAVNKENFPGGILKAGKEFISRTTYAFSCR